LESEAIFILRETAAAFKNPALLFSGGKDSTLLLDLAEKAFYPSPIPFAFVHIDTGHNFPEVIQFRNTVKNKYNLNLIVGSVENSLKRGTALETGGKLKSRNLLQSITLLETIEEYKFDALIGGARRDEEKSRAKERIFSIRNSFGRWDPRNQRVELGLLFNYKIGPDEHVRVFPISNWTERDVWEYITKENMDLPSIYYSHRRRCVRLQDGLLLSDSPFFQPGPADTVEELTVRCRTVGDILCTGLIESKARSPKEVLSEIMTFKQSERASRADDKISESAMEDRKKEGYF
jgi:sulfate adenylyltransferase subunit 2